ncbi:MAG: glycosyl hydrolase 115 family protein [Dysgonomonas mossii]|uniref:glycosyl hydrolase 115 family protein n=1 Tax=Dysgonomonas mossii TaxID=163665 RepID=UPI0026E9336C|nr:glycosyl hydrolase 115 family protein [Dysgonomonas mossii]MBS5906677.1 glycosyl hydrolase 115 family protein [Dysgonomonas mossii]
MNNIKYILLTLCLFPLILFAQADQFVSFSDKEDVFTLVKPFVAAPILIDNNIDSGILKAITNLSVDIDKVTGVSPILKVDKVSAEETVLLIGTIGRSKYIDDLVKNKKINASELQGKYEKYLIQTVQNPFEGVKEALVIAGSDKRGTIYGIYELSKQIGVSPWYYWADVPIKKQQNIYIKRGKYTEGEPAVKYRGIFLNDEAPALSGWANVTFGGFNSKFYEKVFELILRLKGNFLWPAMWGSAFYDDDPQNGVLANEMGIVMSTSHHEPMAMAQSDWHRYVKRNNLPNIWDYTKNTKALQESWRFGMKRAKDWEKVVTVGMRGDGDEAMSEDTNIALLEKIVKDQRKIISEVTGKKPEETPQVWALYKEVQDYYDQGMRVPDDVTLLLCDDNWGNVRKLPEINSKPHKGGYGMYYHFDYVGAPRNSKWININPIQRVWEQMNLTYTHGVDRIWVVNVGDLKPMEYPISFFLDMAWNPSQFNPHNLLDHTENWCEQQFGSTYAKEAARLINLYSKYNRRVTPELLNDKTYSLENYNEFETVMNDYRNLVIDAMRLYYLMPSEYKDAFDQLVLFPINACSNLYEMYYAQAKNKLYAAKKDVQANYWADKVKDCFKRDSLLTVHYNQTIAGGKWPHMMDQVRIGYRSWNNPPKSIMPKVEYIMQTTDYKDKIFVEKNGYVSIEAGNYSRLNNSDRIHWDMIPDMGKTKSAMTTFPQNIYPKENDNIYLEYGIDFQSTGDFNVHLLLSPTLNFNANKGLRYAISVDGRNEQIVNFNGHYKGELGLWQAEAIIKSTTKHTITEKGKHTLRFRVLEPGIVLQKILIDTGGLKPSYLGAPESELK